MSLDIFDPFAIRDKVFAETFAEVIGEVPNEDTARKLFDAGVEFANGGERTSFADPGLKINMSVIPDWLFRDAMMIYVECMIQSFEKEYQSGTINTEIFSKILTNLQNIIESSIITDSNNPERSKLDKNLSDKLKKCEDILNDQML